ncbi:HAAS signaling domain-containing protein [Aquisphaera insulae]|uniref:HAAS signaling domain-containing protein n=1 Tax=Aquisphaera insulae TaxID=2712864 RepID=UPI0013ECC652|nr:hypothetical protein [Aquisphaera insulae]
MMTAAPVMERMSGSLRGLIDSRLDTVDRMLLGRLPRSERLDVVRDVESQIYELLEERAGREGEEVSREDVLAVLARLDPPEAYLSEEAEGEVSPRRTGETNRRERSQTASGIKADAAGRRLALISGLLGIVSFVTSLLLLPLVYVFVSVAPSASNVLVLGFWFSSTTTIFVLETLGIVLAVRAGLHRPWSVVGLVLGILGVLAALGLSAFGLFI